MQDNKKTYVFIGCEKDISRINEKWDGSHIEVCEYDSETGRLKKLHTCLSGVQVGSIRIDPSRNVLYCTNHVKDYPGYGPGGGGEIISAKIDLETGFLTEMNRQPSFGTMPVMMEYDPTGSYLMVANHSQYAPVTKVSQDLQGKYHISKEYDDAPTVLYRLNTDGSIGEACDMFFHGGCSEKTSYPNPHPHCTVRSPLWELYAVCDKGADRVYLMRIDHDKGRISVAGSYDAPPGAAPRYAVFHPEKPFLITNNEKIPVVFSFRYDENGTLQLINSIRIMKEENTPGKKPAPSDLRIHPSGKFIYGLIRRKDIIVAMSVDQESGEISLIQTEPLNGHEAKACAVSPDGRFLFVTAKSDHRIQAYDIAEDGTIMPNGYFFETIEPDNVSFFQG